eukprot:Amastigsp_a14552_6.p2 type:complete len:137 gc:universal Amastigsp_a14552_6:431-21(-)
MVLTVPVGRSRALVVERGGTDALTSAVTQSRRPEDRSGARSARRTGARCCLPETEQSAPCPVQPHRSSQRRFGNASSVSVRWPQWRAPCTGTGTCSRSSAGARMGSSTVPVWVTDSDNSSEVVSSKARRRGGGSGG